MEIKMPIQWYAMRVTYGRELKLKEHLSVLEVNNFVPMQYKETIKLGQRHKKLVPAVHNLIFIQSSREHLDALKKQVDLVTPMRYMIDKATHLPIIIPERQMNDFIAVAGTLDEQLIYMKDVNAGIQKGDRVQIISGKFAGIEGDVLRIKRDRRVVITINGVVAVATAHIPSLLLEKI